MDRKPNDAKSMLQAGIDAMRSAQPDPADMENRAARVWARVKAEQSLPNPLNSAPAKLGACEDYRGLIPDYVSGRLSSARALLVEDHTHECVACRNAVSAARGFTPQPRPVRRARRMQRVVALAGIAAALVAAVALQQAGYLDFLLPVVQVKAVAQTIDGKLYRVAGLQVNAVAAGDAVPAAEPVRTAADSRAIIQLADGTRIEMRERSQVSLTGTRDGVRINLDRGSVIVEAAKQHNGHLYVATDDCTVSVVGTVFAVTTGVKGSRVSVLQGEVHVKQASAGEKALFPGQQITTAAAVENVPIQQDIAWSRDLDAHLALLRAIADVNHAVRDSVPGPQLRFTSTLLPLVPTNTVMYGAFPNLSATLGQAYDLFRQKIDESPVLEDWWARKNQKSTSADVTLEEMIQHVRNLGSYLGQEVVVAVTGSSSGPADALVLAEVLDAPGALAELNSMRSASGEPAIRVLTDAAQLAAFTGTERGPIAYIGDSILVAAGTPRSIYEVVAARRGGVAGFTAGPFYPSIQHAYSGGAGALVAADLATLASGIQNSIQAQALGLAGADRVVFEQKQISGTTVTRAQLSFKGERAGAAAWLAPAAPMGALEFVSPQAYGIASAVTKDAGTILDELLGYVDPDANALAKIQQEAGIDLRRDLAQPLGGEFLFAMDGPFLPIPSWKIVAEVYQSPQLQNTIERLAFEINRRAAENNQPGVTVTSESVGGQIYYRLKRADGVGAEVDYTYALGYIVAASSRALVSQALQYQQTRSSIASSPHFRAMMPADGADHCSAILYQNLTEAAASISSYAPAGVDAVTPEQLKALGQTIERTPPTLVCATAEPNRIVMGYQGDLALNVLMLGGLRDMLQTIGRRN